MTSPVQSRRDALAGVTVGAWAGFSLVSIWIVGVILVVGFGIGAAVGRSWSAGAGLLFGAGVSIMVMLTLATVRCDAGCSPPDLRAFVLTGLSMIVAGGVCTARAVAAARLR